MGAWCQRRRPWAISARTCQRAGVHWIWVNPAQSLQWKVPEVQSFMEECFSIVFDWYEFGRRWRKSTKFLADGPWIACLERRCRRDHRHMILEGSMRGPDGKWVARTALAAEYSEPFCKALLEVGCPLAEALQPPGPRCWSTDW